MRSHIPAPPKRAVEFGVSGVLFSLVVVTLFWAWLVMLAAGIGHSLWAPFPAFSFGQSFGIAVGVGILRVLFT